MSIIFQDYFDSYSLGAHIPTGFTAALSFFSNIIAGGPDGHKAWSSFGQYYRYEASNKNITLFVAIKAEGNPAANSTLFQLANGNPSNFNDPINRVLLTLRVEIDATLTVITGDGQLIGNTGKTGVAFSIEGNAWYLFQLNVTLTQVTVGPSNFINVQAEFATQLYSFFSGSKTTNINVTSVFTGDESANLWIFNNATYDIGALTAEDQVLIGDYPDPGAPVARVSSGVIEVMELPTSGLNRISQGVVEVAQLPTSSLNRISQAVIELMVQQGAPVALGWITKEV